MSKLIAIEEGMKEKKMGGYCEYEVEDALRSLQRAEEVRKDPKLMVQVQKMAKIKMKEIKSIADLKNIRQNLEEEDDEGDEEE